MTLAIAAPPVLPWLPVIVPALTCRPWVPVRPVGPLVLFFLFVVPAALLLLLLPFEPDRSLLSTVSSVVLWPLGFEVGFVEVLSNKKQATNNVDEYMTIYNLTISKLWGNKKIKRSLIALGQVTQPMFMHTPRAQYAFSLQTLQRLRPKVGPVAAGWALAPFPFFGFLVSSSNTSMGAVAVPLPAGLSAACALHGGDTPIAGAIGIGGCEPIRAIGPMGTLPMGTLPMGTLPTGIVGAVGSGIVMGATGCSGVGIAAGVVMGATVGRTGATGGTVCGRTPARHRDCQRISPIDGELGGASGSFSGSLAASRSSGKVRSHMRRTSRNMAACHTCRGVECSEAQHGCKGKMRHISCPSRI